MYHSHLREASTPFPTLDLTEPEAVEWPRQPFTWRHEPVAPNGVAQPCSIDTTGGGAVHGEMLNFDVSGSRVVFRSAPGAPSVSVPFARFRRLTLTAPLRAAEPARGAPVERVPSAIQERDYTVFPVASGPEGSWSGRTAGHVETPAGLFLFTPVEDDAGLLRVFVPRSAYQRCEFGLSAEEAAARLWHRRPDELLAAIERQNRMPVLRIGQSLLSLGMITPAQLERALTQPHAELPLGEALVAAGLISQGDLQMALAHKMGYPMVDLTQFPIDPAALAKLPRAIARHHRVLPLMLDGERLIVAVDNPARVAQLRTLQVYAQVPIVPVLARRVHLIHALGLSDHWGADSRDRPVFQPTTT